jgi:hypothetical protein
VSPRNDANASQFAFVRAEPGRAAPGAAKNLRRVAARSFTPGPQFSPVASTPDGDGIAGLVFPPTVVYGADLWLGTLLFGGTPAWVDLGYTPGDLTEGLATPDGFAAVTFSHGWYIPEPAALALLACSALLLRRR